MNKAEWDAMEARDKLCLILKRVFGMESRCEMAGGALSVVCWWYDADGHPRWREGKEPAFTTDRNACALVLDEIERRELMERLISILIVEGSLQTNVDEWAFMSYGLTVDPDTICYAAVKAVEG